MYSNIPVIQPNVKYGLRLFKVFKRKAPGGNDVFKLIAENLLKGPY
jgi:hypothetical protein